MKIKVTIIVALCALIVIVGPNFVRTDAADHQPAAEVMTTRSQFQLPKLVDFERFKQLFNKHYDSITEELRRKKQFLARSVECAISAVKYRYGLTDYHLSINAMSDWLRQEVKSLFSKSPLLPEDIEADPVDLEAAQAEAIKERQQNLRRFKRSDEPSDDSDDVITSKNMDENRFRYLRTQMIRLNSEDSKTPDLIRNVNWYILWSMDEEKWKRIDAKLQDSEQRKLISKHQPDKVEIDHSQTGCMNEAKTQSKCGACYAFAFTALIEHLHCKETGKLETFSEQYYVDCGKTRPEYQLYGCAGGMTTNLASLMRTIGVEYQQKYVYKAEEDVCEYEPEVDPLIMGELRADDMSTGLVVPKIYMEKYIQFAPMVVSISVPDDFFDYGDGVHDGSNCRTGDLGRHAMLLVGSGREDGVDYWIIRNSFSNDWGHNGYFKVNKVSDCFMPRAGFMLATLNGRDHSLGLKPNPMYERREKRTGFQIPFFKKSFWK